ncbi:MAG: enoyl-CoA hydratase [Rhodospirillaceae bacterium]|nr:enoyl-CoA hydratase [Rhodospirillaceae bacterium]|tara:strand:+ start:2499 stop:3347 length:849 start_codon:yes stop_codon:yes gene_type:complete
MAKRPNKKARTAGKKPRKSKYKFIKVNKRNNICSIQLNRPDFLNAINIEMSQEISNVLIEAETDRKITAIILSGNDRSFCAGADLGRMGSKPEDRFDMYRERFNIAPNRQLYRVLCFYTKPVISAVEGYCLGGGFEMAMWGDFIIAGKNSQFGLPEVRHSLIPGGGGTQNLPRLIGPALAKEMIWTGRRLGADEAKELRIVNHVVPSGQALKKAKEIVSEMAKNGPLGIMMSKQAINRGLDQSRFNGFLGEGDLAHMLTFSEDRAAGLTAFKERRRADFKGQ